MRKTICAGTVWSIALLGAALAVPPAAGAAVDLQVNKSDAADPVNFESDVTYTIQVTNAGSDPATGVQVVDQLPPKSQVQFKSASLGCTYATPSAQSQEQTVTCLAGGLAGSGGAASFQIVVKTKSPGTISNSASATSTEQPDGNPADNLDTETTKVRRRFNLSIRLTEGDDPTRVGNILSYRIGVINAGPHNAEGVVVRDELPAGVRFVSADDECTHSGGIVSCLIGVLSGSPSVFLPTAAHVDIQVRPTMTGTLTNVAKVSAPLTDDQYEGDTTNNAKRVRTTALAALPSLRPGACANRQSGNGARNLLLGTRRGDRLLGRGGRDRLFGWRGRDCLLGGSGGDVLNPGRGRDVAKGGAGSDRILAADGQRDVVNCGRGFDRVEADRRDRLRGCEKRL